MRTLPLTAAKDIAGNRDATLRTASTLLTSNRPAEDRAKLLGDTTAVTAILDRLLHHGTRAEVQTTELTDEGHDGGKETIIAAFRRKAGRSATR